jgi:acyl carrier protein
MKNLKTEKKVLEIVNKISGGRVKNINPDGDLKTELSLDSIQIVELFASLEKEFAIELPLQMMTVKTSKEFLQMLEEQLDTKVLSHA